MLIYMLAAAMTIAMLIATAFGIHQEVAARARQGQPGKWSWLRHTPLTCSTGRWSLSGDDVSRDRFTTLHPQLLHFNAKKVKSGAAQGAGNVALFVSVPAAVRQNEVRWLVIRTSLDREDQDAARAKRCEAGGRELFQSAEIA